jgi:hypothetical protein
MDLLVMKFCSLVGSDIARSLHEMFVKQEFNTSKSYDLIKIDLVSSIVYESTDTEDMTWRIQSDDVEYIVHPCKRFCVHKEFQKHLKNALRSSSFGLLLCIQQDPTLLTIMYDPAEAFKHDASIPKFIFDEYVMLYYMFQDIHFYNHCSSYFMTSDRPKISISFRGHMINKPNIEYYVVFETPTYYTVQVFSINSQNRRDTMLFGVWIDAEKKKISDPYIIST